MKASYAQQHTAWQQRITTENRELRRSLDEKAYLPVYFYPSQATITKNRPFKMEISAASTVRLPSKVEYTSPNVQNQEEGEEEDQEGMDTQKTEERLHRTQNSASLRRSLDANKLKNGGSFLGTLLNYGGSAVGFGPEDVARAEEHQRMVVERKGHSRVYPYFKLDNPIISQSSQFQARPQTSGSSQRGIGGILTGGGEISQADEIISYTTSHKSLKSSTMRVSTAGKSIRSRRQLSILGKDGKVSTVSRKSHSRPLEAEDQDAREDSKPALSYRSLKVYFQNGNPNHQQNGAGGTLGQRFVERISQRNTNHNQQPDSISVHSKLSQISKKMRSLLDNASNLAMSAIHTQSTSPKHMQASDSVSQAPSRKSQAQSINSKKSTSLSKANLKLFNTIAVGQAQSVPEHAFSQGAQVNNLMSMENPPELDLVMHQTAPISNTGKGAVGSSSHRSLSKIDSKSSLHMKDQMYFSQDNRNAGASLVPKTSAKIHQTLAVSSPREIGTAIPQARRDRKTINQYENEEDEDLLEYEERKDMVDDLINNHAIQRKSMMQLRQKKSSSTMSMKSYRPSSAKKLQAAQVPEVESKLEEGAGSTQSLLSNKDYEEIRSIVRQKSQRSALSSKKSESALSVRGDTVPSQQQDQYQMIPNDTKSIYSNAITETTYRSQVTKYSDSPSMFSDALSKTTVNRLEDQLLHERLRRKMLEQEVHNLKKLSQDLISKIPSSAAAQRIHSAASQLQPVQQRSEKSASALSHHPSIAQ